MFDVVKLKLASGDKVFARGVAYFDNEAVDLTLLSDDRVKAQVFGSEAYTVELKLEAGEIDGRCSCPAFRDFGFCKHMVATALAANHAKSSGEKINDGTALPAYLETLDRPTLIKLVLELADSHPDIEAKLLRQSAFSGGDANDTIKVLRREIDRATEVPDYVEYGEAAGWAEDPSEVLDALKAAIPRLGAEVLPLLDRLADNVEEASENIEDSEGEVYGLMEAIADVHLEACKAVRPDPIQLAADLFDRELEQRAGYYDCIEAYADVLGEAGVKEMGRLARKLWDDIPPADRKRASGVYESTFVRDHLLSILDHLAAQTGDLEERIALRRRHLAKPDDYRALFQFCGEQGREEEAIKWIEEALFLFEDEDNHILAVAAAEILARNNRHAQAQALLWRSFAARPSLQLHAKLIAGLKAAARKEVTDRAVAILKASAQKQPSNSWSRHPSADLSLSILMDEKRYDDAWVSATELGGSVGALERLAQATEVSHPEHATSAYRRNVELALVNASGDYTAVKKLIDRAAAIAQRTGKSVAHDAYVANLLEKHRAKRNFMKLMGVAPRKAGQ